jgi:hypothetical protein
LNRKNNRSTKCSKNVKLLFSLIADELIHQNRRNLNSQMPKQKINCCANTIFIFPVTENEVEYVTKNLKGKLSTAFDVIPENIVKQCITYIKSLWLIFIMLYFNPVFFQMGGK